MLQIACIGKIVTKPETEDKGMSCRLEVNLGGDQLTPVKLIAYGASVDVLAEGKLVFVTGTLAPLEKGSRYAQISARVVQSADEPTLVYGNGSGEINYVRQHEDYASFKLNMYSSPIKGYINVDVNSNHPFTKSETFTNGKYIHTAGNVKLKSYHSKKQDKEIYEFGIAGYSLEMINPKASEYTKSAKNKSNFKSIDFSSNNSSLDDMPF